MGTVGSRWVCVKSGSRETSKETDSSVRDDMELAWNGSRREKKKFSFSRLILQQLCRGIFLLTWAFSNMQLHVVRIYTFGETSNHSKKNIWNIFFFLIFILRYLYREVVSV